MKTKAAKLAPTLAQDGGADMVLRYCLRSQPAGVATGAELLAVADLVEPPPGIMDSRTLGVGGAEMEGRLASSRLTTPRLQSAQRATEEGGGADPIVGHRVPPRAPPRDDTPRPAPRAPIEPGITPWHTASVDPAAAVVTHHGGERSTTSGSVTGPPPDVASLPPRAPPTHATPTPQSLLRPRRTTAASARVAGHDAAAPAWAPPAAPLDPRRATPTTGLRSDARRRASSSSSGVGGGGGGGETQVAEAAGVSVVSADVNIPTTVLGNTTEALDNWLFQSRAPRGGEDASEGAARTPGFDMSRSQQDQHMLHSTVLELSDVRRYSNVTAADDVYYHPRR